MQLHSIPQVDAPGPLNVEQLTRQELVRLVNWQRKEQARNQARLVDAVRITARRTAARNQAAPRTAQAPRRAAANAAHGA